MNPVPPVSGNDATVAGLQLIIAGDQYNTISKPSEIVGGAAADVADKLLKGETPEPKTTIFGSPAEALHPDAGDPGEPQGRDHRQEHHTRVRACTAEYASGVHAAGGLT